MASNARNAYITGGASGIGKALAVQLLEAGWRVFIVDRNLSGIQSLMAEHNQNGSIVGSAECEVSSWDSQLLAFQQGLRFLEGRIDFVAPVAGIGEKKWLPFAEATNSMPAGNFAKPDLTVVDVDLTGVLYTVSLAVQQFRRQPLTTANGWAHRGKLGLVASASGFYCVPGLPIYTAAKHAVVGFTRSYGTLLQDEGITVNALAPHVVRTAISSDPFYEQVEKAGLLTPMDGLMSAFWDMVNESGSGRVYECGSLGGWKLREGAEWLDVESRESFGLLQGRARGLHYASL